MADITDGSTQDGSTQQQTDAQHLDDMTSLQTAPDTLDPATGDVTTVVQADTPPDNPSNGETGTVYGGTTLPEGSTFDYTQPETASKDAASTGVVDTATNTDPTTVTLDAGTNTTTEETTVTLDATDGQGGTQGTTTTTTGTGGPAPAAGPTPTGTTTTTTPTVTTDPVTAAPTTQTTQTTPTTTTDPTTGGISDPGTNDSASGIILKIFAIVPQGTTGAIAYDVLNADGTVKETIYLSASNTISEPGTAATSTANYVVFAVDSTGKPLATQPLGDVNINFTPGTASSSDYSPADGSSTIAIGERFTANAETDGDNDSGELFTVSIEQGSYSLNPAATISTDPVTTTILDGALPSLTITKVADVSSVDAADDVIEYTITVSNTGNQTLTGVVLTDEFATATLFSGDTDEDGSLDVGESWVYTASHTVTQDEMDAGITLTNVASVDTNETDPESDDVDTTITQNASLTITKVADVSSVDAADDVITYTITVSNAGNVSLTGVVLTDEFATATYVGGDLDEDNALDVGESWTYTAAHTVSQDEIDLGADLVNVAEVDTNETDPESDDAVVTVDQNPSLTITKVADVSSVDAADDVIEYTITVSNTGNQTLTGVVLTDEFATATLFSGDTDEDGSLDVGESWVYTASHTVTQDEMDAGITLTNVASVDTNETDPESDDVDTTITQNASLTITKVADVSSVDAADDVITYTITVSNAGNVSLTGVVLTDEFATATYVGGDLDEDNALDVGESWTYTAAHTVSQDEIDLGADLVNVAEVDTNETDPESDDAVVTVDQNPSLTITKVADVSSVDAADDVIEYTITVSNTGNQTLTGVVLTDEFATATLFSGDTDEDGSLDVGESWVYTASHTVTQDEMDAGITLTNVASVDTNETDPESDDVDTTITQNASLTITKVADVSSVDAADDVITYTITVSNAGNVSLTGVVLTDEFATATYVGGDLDEDNALDVGESWTYTAAHTVSQDEIDLGADLVNVAEVDTNETDPESDDAVVTVDQNPSLTITKVADVSSVDAADDVIEYTITVSNTGNQTLTGVVLTDEFATATLFSGDTDEDGSLDVGESWVYTASHTVTQDEMDAGITLTNVASVDTNETDPESDDVDTTITQNASLTITKVADVSSVDAADDVITYTITVSNAGNVSLTGVVLTDEFATATYVGGDLDEDNALDVGESWTYTAAHTVSQDEIDLGADLVNVAEVDTNETDPESDDAVVTVDQNPSLTITKVADVSSVDAADDVIEYTITVSNTGNQTLTGVVLTDEFATATLFSGDTDEDGSLDVGESWVYTASHTVTQDEMDAGITLTNVASVDTNETDPESDDVDTTITQNASLTITKVADVSSVDAADDVITYTITVSNAGNVSLTGVVLTDEFATATYVGGDLDEDNALDVGESWTYTAAHTVSQDEIDLGADLVNVAEVDTNETDPESDDAVVTVDQNPSLTITKVADVSSVDAADDVIEYTITVSNTGNQTLTGVVLTDEFATATLFSGDTDEDGSLDVGESWVYTASHTVTQDEMDAGITLTNVASVDTNETDPESDDVDTTITQNASLTITKVADVSSVDAADDVITYTITVSNAGNVSLTGVVLTDEFATATYVGGDLDEDNALDVGESWTYTAAHTVSQDEIDLGADLVNVAEVDTNETDPESDDAVVTVDQNPSLTITKVADVSSVDAADDVIEYTITVSNTGNQTLTGVVLTDEFATATLFSGDTDEDGSLDVGESWVYTASHTVTQDEMDAGITLTNVASVDTNETDPESDDVDTTITQNASLTITKVADVSSVDAADDVITYTITVSNAGNVSLTGVVLTDEFATATYVGGDLDEDNALDVGESWTYTAAHTVSQDEIDLGADLVNVAEVDTNETDPESDDAVVTVDQNPSLTITKVADVSSVDAADDVIEYTITVSNTGNQTLTGVVLTDEFATATLFSGDTDEDGSLDVGESWVYTASHTVTQDEMDAGITLTNVASVDTNETDPESDDVDTTITQNASLTITKVADVSSVDAADDVITYTITVSNAGNVSLTGVVLTDEFATATYVGGDLDEDNALDVGESWTYTAAHTVSQDEIDLGADLVNVAEVDTNETDPESDDAVVTVTQTPELTIMKSGVVRNFDNSLDSDNAVESDSDYVEYTVTVENTGNQTLSAITLTDAKVPGNIGSILTFKVGEIVNGSFVQDGSITVSGTLGLNGKITLDPSFDLSPDKALNLSYNYDVTTEDLYATSIENIAIVDSDNTNPVDSDYENPNSGTDGVASYEITVLKADVAIRKFADVRTVSNGDEIGYKLVVTNEGTSSLTSVKVDDAMFASAVDVDGSLSGKQISATLNTINSDGTVTSTSTSYTIDANGDLVIGDLGVNQYVEISYAHTVTTADYDIITTGVTESIFDYTGTDRGPIGNVGDPVTFSYGSFSAYVNKDASDPYALNGDPARVFVNVDNTGVAVGVNAGVMAGDRNYNSDHLKATFNSSSLNGGKSIVESTSLVFTNAKDVEVAFTVNYGVPGELSKTFTGSIVVDGRGDLSLRELSGATGNYSLIGTSTKSGSVYSFNDSDPVNGLLANWFTVTEANGPGGAQNKLYTLNFAPGDQFVNSFDFWVVGDDTDTSADQIKVVDIKFNTLDFKVTDVVNTATVFSAEDNSDEQSDEISTTHVSVLTDLDASAAAIFANLDDEIPVAKLKVDTEAQGTISLSGSPEKGSTLTATASITDTDDTSAPLAMIYQWQVNTGTLVSPIWENISGANSASFAIPNSDLYVGKQIRLSIETTDDLGGKSVISSSAKVVTPPDTDATGTVTFSGAQEGGVLTANTSGLSDSDGTGIATIGYQWEENTGTVGAPVWSAISGATSSTLSVPSDQSWVGKQVRLGVVTVDSLGGETEKFSSAQTIANVNDATTGNWTLSYNTTSKKFTANISGLSDEDGGIKSATFTFEYYQSTGGSPGWKDGGSLTITLPATTGDSAAINANLSGNDWRVTTSIKDVNDVIQTSSAKAFIPNSISSTAGSYAAPIAVDLNGDGIQYLAVDAGVAHDYNGDGVAENTAWVGADDGLLAKVNEDGSLKIVFSTQDGETDLQGLAKTDDTNQDGVLDSHDTFFSQFGVWQDADSDGIVDTGEFKSLADRDIKSLNLVSDGQTGSAAGGDVIVYGSTTYTKTDNTTGLAEDVGFVIGMNDSVNDIHQTFVVTSGSDLLAIGNFDQSSQLDLSHVLPDHGFTGDNLKDYIHLVDNGVNTIVSIDADGASGPLGWVEIASFGNVHVNQPGVDMFFDPTTQTIDFSKDAASPWKVEDGDTPAV